MPNGEISNALGGKCIGADGDAVSLMACDGGSTWQMQGNGGCICAAGAFLHAASSCIHRSVEAGPIGGTVFEPEGIRGWG